ncbi:MULTISPECIES: hypothetical protein [Paraburkholderia]|uniref:hypothetical protein n=1 Tax=Paraburkholderia TaxID=1822464 RepID=UPI000370F9C5|nr:MULTISPECIES: hypothetical protein [Paraburkholderia]MDH6150418.1 hypothetical protein [Paraburkholderia sp. WSM4179]
MRRPHAANTAALTPGLSVSVWLVPAWFVLMWGGYMIKRRREVARAGMGAASR